MNLAEKIKKSILQRKMFSTGDPVMVGVSGGPDSVFLLYILDTLKHHFGISLHVVHVNHHLRKSARRDEEFTRRLSRQWRLPFTAVSVSVGKSKGKSSIEEIAREERFKALMRIAKQHDSTIIALGHTKDDLAETVLMRVLRGTGLWGMRAILPKRDIAGFTIIRPLLNITKKEILYFLKAKKLRYCVDPSNKTMSFLRNKVRLKLLPALQKEYNPNIKQVLASLTDSVSADYDFLAGEGEKSFRRIARLTPHKKEIRVASGPLLSLHPSLQHFVIRRAIEQLKGNARRITFAHTEEILDLLKNRPLDALVHLPLGMSALKNKSHIIFGVRNT